MRLAVFGYEKHHDLKLLDSGAGGPDELAEKFSTTSIMYGLCRIQDPGTGAHRIVLINWEASVVLSARRTEEVTQEGLSRALAKLAPAAAPALTKRVTPPDAQELVGTNYRKTNPALEIRRTKRDSFWAQAEEQQQREYEEAMRERSRRSESIEKAAEAAVLVSQRSQNPRDFFRQRERSGSTSGTPLPASPLGTRPGSVGQPGQEPARGNLGHNGIGGHEQGGWPAPWENTLPEQSQGKRDMSCSWDSRDVP
ncbi:basic proline-rich [Limosa lapponica baueri]|uniref:Basic proline-rich n=1 Tax=Limosa lapponica baueri TaxID=1758121 RepID=A0A2I0UL51_LIMLA|nr:basic proline-rich [Limosa lapponica baueri]